MNPIDELIERYGFSKDENPVSTVVVGGPVLAARRAMTAAFDESKHARNEGTGGDGKESPSDGGKFKSDKGASSGEDVGDNGDRGKMPWKESLSRLDEFTGEDVAAGKVPGIKEGELREGIAAHARDVEITMAPTEGPLDTVLVAHEAGHYVANEIQREAGRMDIEELTPFRKDPGYEVVKDMGNGRLRVKQKDGAEMVIYARAPGLENPFGLNPDPGEILADTYSELLHAEPYEDDGSDFAKPRKALLNRVAATAKKMGLPYERTYRVSKDGSEKVKAVTAAFNEAAHERNPASGRDGKESPQDGGKFRSKKGGSSEAKKDDDGKGGNEAVDKILGGAADTQQKYKKGGKMVDGEYVGGTYDPERFRDVHAPWMIERLAEGKTVDGQPTALFMAGGGGSGKDYILGSGKLEVPLNAPIIDPDSAKQVIPEFHEIVKAGSIEQAAPRAHEESSDMAKALSAEALKMKTNIVVNGTGNNSEKSMLGKLNKAKEQGYKVEVTMVDIPTEEAVKRALTRANDPKSPSYGRLPDLKILREQHRQVVRNHLAWRDEVDDWSVWANDERGKEHVIAYRKGGGKIVVVDKPRYKQTLEKGN